MISYSVCVPGVRPDAEALRPVGGESPAGDPLLSHSHQSALSKKRAPFKRHHKTATFSETKIPSMILNIISFT